jgi:malonyl CoA-acyl carrier protein transacylase
VRRALVVCPGRGADGPETGAREIYRRSIADHSGLADRDLEPVAVCGNSMGWYTALVAGGSLPFEDGERLVLTMERIHAEETLGGQIVYPADPEAVEAALAKARGFAAPSVDLGGYVVLGGDDEGIASLRELLPPVVSGGRTYPIGMPGHSAFHTALMADRAERARETLGHSLSFVAPVVPLIDGRGAPHRPLTADPAEIRDYTLGAQITETFDLAAAVRVGLREYAPDAVVLLGPGSSIAGALAMTLIREGYRGVTSRADFDRLRDDGVPLLVTLG